MNLFNDPLLVIKLTQVEAKALDKWSKEKQMSRKAIIKQALKIYDSIENGSIIATKNLNHPLNISEKAKSAPRCTVCGEHPVNTDAGFDTCFYCMKKQ